MLVFSALILNDLAHHLWCNTRMESYFRIVWEKLNCIRSTVAQGYYARTPPHPPSTATLQSIVCTCWRPLCTREWTCLEPMKQGNFAGCAQKAVLGSNGFKEAFFPLLQVSWDLRAKRPLVNFEEPILTFHNPNFLAFWFQHTHFPPKKFSFRIEIPLHRITTGHAEYKLEQRQIIAETPRAFNTTVILPSLSSFFLNKSLAFYCKIVNPPESVLQSKILCRNVNNLLTPRPLKKVRMGSRRKMREQPGKDDLLQFQTGKMHKLSPLVLFKSLSSWARIGKCAATNKYSRSTCVCFPTPQPRGRSKAGKEGEEDSLTHTPLCYVTAHHWVN